MRLFWLVLGLAGACEAEYPLEGRDSEERWLVTLLKAQLAGDLILVGALTEVRSYLEAVQRLGGDT